MQNLVYSCIGHAHAKDAWSWYTQALLYEALQTLWTLDFTERKTLASAVICIRELLRFNMNSSAGNGKQFLPSDFVMLGTYIHSHIQNQALTQDQLAPGLLIPCGEQGFLDNKSQM